MERLTRQAGCKCHWEVSLAVARAAAESIGLPFVPVPWRVNAKVLRSYDEHSPAAPMRDNTVVRNSDYAVGASCLESSKWVLKPHN